MKKALVLLFDKFEEIEAIAPIDIMRRAGVDVLTASLESGLCVVGRSGITVEADAFFKDVCRRNFDIVVLPGGPGVHNLKGCEPVRHCRSSSGNDVHGPCLRGGKPRELRPVKKGCFR